MDQFGYRKLVAYQKSKDVVKQAYKLLRNFPIEERYALCDQLRRASVSVTSNIAEGMTRFSTKEKCHYIEIAFGSLMEVSSQLEIAMELGYISSEDLQNMDILIAETGRLLSGLQKNYRESNTPQS